MVCTEMVWATATQDPKPRLLVVDEVWSIMQHPEGEAFLVSVARGRASGHSGRVLLQNAAFKLLLQRDAAAISTVGDALGLPEDLQRWLLSCPRGDGLLLARRGRFPVRIDTTTEETDVIEWWPGSHRRNEDNA